MTSKILKSILSVSGAVLAACLIIITGMLYEYFGDYQEAQLKDELQLAAGAVEGMGETYLKKLDSDHYRLTWVKPDGTVYYDSAANAAAMENHGNREEIREAMISGAGSSSRYSDTLTEQTIYEAVRLADGSVLRISVSRATAFVLVLGMIQPMGMVWLLAMLFSTWLAHRMAKRITDPLNRLDLDNPLENESYEELSPLLHRIHSQHREIEERMHALKQQRKEFEQITDNMKEALILLDENGRVLSLNPMAEKLFQTKKSYVGTDFLTVDRRQSMRTAMREAATKGHSAFRDSQDGREIQFNLSRIDAGENSRGMVILAFDITEQVNAEKHRQEFTANFSHELKTPLQSILGAAELMKNDMVKPEDTPQFVERIYRETAHLITLIDDIIRLSRLDEGVAMEWEEVSLREVCDEIREEFAAAAEQKGVSLVVSGEEGLIIGVRRLLYETIYNLCENAVKYNKPGGSVTLAVINQPTGVCLQVQDTGIGIPAEHQEKIFERFYRVDKSHSKSSGGTGLGLSIVKHAVQLQHGTIQVESVPDEGTTISVFFSSKAAL